MGPSPCPILSTLIRPRDFFRLLAIGMCHFLPVHHLGIAFLGRVEGQNITVFQMGSRDTTVYCDSWSDSICSSPGANSRFCNWHPYTVTEPPPCFTFSAIHEVAALSPTPRCTETLLFEPKISNFDSSVKKNLILLLYCPVFVRLSPQKPFDITLLP